MNKTEEPVDLSLEISLLKELGIPIESHSGYSAVMGSGKWKMKFEVKPIKGKLIRFLLRRMLKP